MCKYTGIKYNGKQKCLWEQKFSDWGSPKQFWGEDDPS